MPGLTESLGLLERSTAYALTAVADIGPTAWHASTTCADWDLTALLQHLLDGLEALCEGLCGAVVAPPDAWTPGPEDRDLTGAFRRRASALLAACGHAGAPDRRVVVGTRLLDTSMLVLAGAVELAVHGWDVRRACGTPRPIPPRLATELLDVCRILVDEDNRQPQFGPAVAVPPSAPAGDRLVAFLARQPYADGS